MGPLRANCYKGDLHPPLSNAQNPKADVNTQGYREVLLYPGKVVAYAVSVACQVTKTESMLDDRDDGRRQFSPEVKGWVNVRLDSDALWTGCFGIEMNRCKMSTLRNEVSLWK